MFVNASRYKAMKVLILSPDLSNNCLGRAYLLAKILQRHYEVEIAGPIFGKEIWEPVANDKSIIYKPIKISGRFKAYYQIKKLIRKIDGDIIYASKPLFTSFGVGLLKKIFTNKPLILDIDDWQMGFVKEGFGNLSLSLKTLVSSTVRLYSEGSYWNNLICEKLTNLADEITVSNTFLKNKFGGTIVCHARDTKTFDPSQFDKSILRDKYNIKINDKVVMFFGTPRLHKGIEDLIEAISLIEDQDIFLAVVGIDYRDKYCNKLVEVAKKKLNDRFKAFGLQPFEKVPEFLAVADIVAIPQKRSISTVGQVPAKIFDAMAMAKPIIATNVSDMPEILEGCGWIVEPENPNQIAEIIQYILEHPSEAGKMGFKARQKCIEKYSWNAIEKILVEVFRKYE